MIAKRLIEIGIPPLTGAGPGVMSFVLKHFIHCRKKIYGDHYPTNLSTQGIRIVLNFLEPPCQYVERCQDFHHLVFRKKALYGNIYGVLVQHGGLGTFDEMLETWRRNIPVSLLGGDFYGPILGKVNESIDDAGLRSQVKNIEPFITDSVNEGVDFILANCQNGFRPPLDDKSVLEAALELEDGLNKLSKLPRAIVIMGHPADNTYGREVVQTMQNFAEAAWMANVPIRAVSRGMAFEALVEVARNMNKEHLLQVVLLKWNGDREWSPAEQFFSTYFPQHTILANDDSNHQLLSSYDARAFYVLPGGIGTYNKAFDYIIAAQTGTVRRKPILMQRSFYQPVLDALDETFTNYDPPTISPGDVQIATQVETIDEIRAATRIRGRQLYPRRQPKTDLLNMAPCASRLVPSSIV